MASDLPLSDGIRLSRAHFETSFKNILVVTQEVGAWGGPARGPLGARQPWGVLRECGRCSGTPRWLEEGGVQPDLASDKLHTE